MMSTSDAFAHPVVVYGATLLKVPPPVSRLAAVAKEHDVGISADVRTTTSSGFVVSSAPQLRMPADRINPPMPNRNGVCRLFVFIAPPLFRGSAFSEPCWGTFRRKKLRQDIGPVLEVLTA